MCKKSWVVREDSKTLGRGSKDSKTPESQGTPHRWREERAVVMLRKLEVEAFRQSQDDYKAWVQSEVCKDCWNTGTVVIQVAGRSVPDCWENFVYHGVYCLNVTESHWGLLGCTQ